MIPRQTYQMNHNWITETGIGTLTPFMCQEVVPGESWGGSVTALIRMAPMLQPAFLTLKANLHLFYVPYRIIDDDWEDYITDVDGTAAIPTVNYADISTSSARNQIPQALGIGNLPGGFVNGIDNAINALPIRAYNKIYTEFFEDQQNATSPSQDNLNLQQVDYSKRDYLTTLRDDIEQGSEVTIDVSGGTLGMRDLRDSQAEQRIRERRAKFGEKYEDYLRSDYGIKPSDIRLSRPEHIARGSGTIGISEVVATATSAGETTGEYKGHGIGAMRMRVKKRFFPEHGVLMGVFFTRPRFQIAERRDRMWQVATQAQRDEYFYNPLKANNQMQATRAYEVNSRLHLAAGTGILGYQENYAHLRQARDTIANVMQFSQYNDWTFARRFGDDDVPTTEEVRGIPSTVTLFQDQTAGSIQQYCYFNNNMYKKSPVKRPVR